jgi:ribonuclease R
MICYITSSGFNVRLHDTGIEGFVDLRKDPEKFSFDKWTASLTSTTRRFELEQEVDVEFAGALEKEGWQAQLTLVEGCGIKPLKT